MRLGVVYDPAVCPYYRAIDPLKALERRGHEVVWSRWPDDLSLGRLGRCDVVHVYRIHGQQASKLFGSLIRDGTRSPTTTTTTSQPWLKSS